MPLRRLVTMPLLAIGLVCGSAASTGAAHGPGAAGRADPPTPATETQVGIVTSVSGFYDGDPEHPAATPHCGSYGVTLLMPNGQTHTYAIGGELRPGPISGDGLDDQIKAMVATLRQAFLDRVNGGDVTATISSVASQVWCGKTYDNAITAVLTVTNAPPRTPAPAVTPTPDPASIPHTLTVSGTITGVGSAGEYWPTPNASGGVDACQIAPVEMTTLDGRKLDLAVVVDSTGPNPDALHTIGTTQTRLLTTIGQARQLGAKAQLTLTYTGPTGCGPYPLERITAAQLTIPPASVTTSRTPGAVTAIHGLHRVTRDGITCGIWSIEVVLPDRLLPVNFAVESTLTKGKPTAAVARILSALRTSKRKDRVVRLTSITPVLACGQLLGSVVTKVAASKRR